MVRNRHHHVFALDQVFVFDFAFLIDDHRATRGRELGLHRIHLVLDDRLNAGA